MKKITGKGLYRMIRWVIAGCYPRIRVEGLEKLPEEPVILVGNHSQMNGPIAAELYGPGEHYTWCAGQMMHLKDVPEYAYRDFWWEKPKWQKPFYKLLSYLIAPLCVCIFRNARTIGVYHDARIIGTFKQTVKRLQEGANVIIFPEYAENDNHILCKFQEKFVDVAKLYHKRTGKCLRFVPMYLAPRLKTMYLGEPVTFDPQAPMEAERSRICRYLADQITGIATELPEHTVIPYRNIPKKQYGTNLPKEGNHEKTSC